MLLHNRSRTTISHLARLQHLQASTMPHTRQRQLRIPSLMNPSLEIRRKPSNRVMQLGERSRCHNGIWTHLGGMGHTASRLNQVLHNLDQMYILHQRLDDKRMHSSASVTFNSSPASGHKKILLFAALPLSLPKISVYNKGKTTYSRHYLGHLRILCHFLTRVCPALNNHQPYRLVRAPLPPLRQTKNHSLSQKELDPHIT